MKRTQKERKKENTNGIIKKKKTEEKNMIDN